MSWEPHLRPRTPPFPVHHPPVGVVPRVSPSGSRNPGVVRLPGPRDPTPLRSRSHSSSRRRGLWAPEPAGGPFFWVSTLPSSTSRGRGGGRPEPLVVRSEGPLVPTVETGARSDWSGASACVLQASGGPPSKDVTKRWSLARLRVPGLWESG